MAGFATAKDLDDRLEKGEAVLATGVIGLLTNDGRLVDWTRERYPLLRIARRTNMNVVASGLLVVLCRRKESGDDVLLINE